jgi:hypothetical protein
LYEGSEHGFQNIPHIFQSPIRVIEVGRSDKKAFCANLLFTKENITLQLKYESTFLTNASRHLKGRLFMITRLPQLCHSGKNKLQIRMNNPVERLRKDIDRRKPKEQDSAMLKFPFVHHKTQMDLPGIELGAQ